METSQDISDTVSNRPIDLRTTENHDGHDGHDSHDNHVNEQNEEELTIPEVIIRARAYRLNEQNEWGDIATGTCVPEQSDDEMTLTIYLKNEEDQSKDLFNYVFHRDQEISRQQGFLRVEALWY